MGASKLLKKAFIEKNVKPGAVADALGVDRQVFYNKINRDKMSFADAEKIAAAAGCRFVLVDEKTSKIIE